MTTRQSRPSNSVALRQWKMEQLELRRVLDASSLVISEFMASNDNTLVDAEGDDADSLASIIESDFPESADTHDEPVDSQIGSQLIEVEIS